MTIPSLHLLDGRQIPAIGLGTYPLNDDDARAATASAIESGYRLIDTAKMYGNEVGVGEAIRSSTVPREELFVTTKLLPQDHGYDQALESFEGSLARLGLDRVDLYLIHWPVPSLDLYVDSWKALIEIQRRGLSKSIGVSNFQPQHLQRIITETGVVPVVNQIELHPHFPQDELRAFNASLGIVTESWSPLSRQRFIEQEPILQTLAATYGKTVSQVVLRWHTQLGAVPIPKSANAARQRENLDIFDFELTSDDLAQIAKLDRGAAGRQGNHPDNG